MATELITHPTGADGATTPSGADAPAVRVRGLCRAFGDHTVLKDLDLEIAPGELVAVLGRSGSGKSTLLRTLAGLDTVQRGSVEVRGTVATAFQQPRLFPWKRVRDNVALALRETGRTDRQRRASAALSEVGLEDKQRAWPETLSGGQAQRASLARALVAAPDLLLLDEPFSALDALTRIETHDLVLSLWREHRPAVLLVTHDVDEALKLADRVLVVEDGRIGHACRVEQSRPRHPHELTDLRDRLLHALGVHEGAPHRVSPTPSPLSQEKAS